MSTPPCLWQPTAAACQDSQMAQFRRAAAAATQQSLPDYASLYSWSIQHKLDFWHTLWRYLELPHSGSAEPIYDTSSTHLGGRFFPQLKLNFAECLLQHGNSTQPAIVAISETRPRQTLSYRELTRQVVALAATLRALGIQAGDRVAAILPNCPEALVAMLATTSLGAVWSSCSPDFGATGICERFVQIEPRCLITINAYRYNGKTFSCADKIAQVSQHLPSVEHVISISYDTQSPALPQLPCPRVAWQDAVAEAPASATPLDALQVEHWPFNHPVYILYSSGTTGVPKCIVHGAGGTLLQHSKELLLHCDLRPSDNITYYTTCGWMMWNWLASALSCGACLTLLDCAPSAPSLNVLWQHVERERITHFGTSAKFLAACRDKIQPRSDAKFEHLRVILSTGSPLLHEDFDWVYQQVKTDLQLSSIAGGTDIISCFMLGNPCLPVYRGEIQCFGLGMEVAAFDTQQQPIVQQPGELVCRTPFPSQPVSFWHDPQDARYRQAYFPHGDAYWYHGDHIELSQSQGDCGGIVIYGRSDATLNPGGVRIGTAEIYRPLESMPEISDSIAVGQQHQGDVRILLFVQLAAATQLDAALRTRINQTLRNRASPRHVPAAIYAVPAIPYTMSGKKVELAVTDIIHGRQPKNVHALKNPEALTHFAAAVMTTESS